MAHGKSTVVKAISGVQTVRFKNELERNITIKLGYANAKIYKCPTCERPSCYRAYGSSKVRRVRLGASSGSSPRHRPKQPALLSNWKSRQFCAWPCVHYGPI